MSQDFTIRRGNNVPVVFDITPSEEPFPLDEMTAVLAIVWRSGRIDRSSPDAGLSIVADAGVYQVIWTPTLAETRRIPKGKVASYELELRYEDTQMTVASGAITVAGGDVGDA